MENKETWREFRAAPERRFGEFEQWTLQHWPDRDHPLSEADFSPFRYELSRLGAKLKTENHHRESEPPEPSKGGPQYINTDPEPWP